MARPTVLFRNKTKGFAGYVAGNFVFDYYGRWRYIMKDVVTLVVGLAAAIFAVYKFVVFLQTPGAQSGTNHVIWAGVALVVAIICGALYFSGRVNKEEEIHITQ